MAVVPLEEMDRPRTAAHTDGCLKLIAGPRAVARDSALGLRLAARRLFGDFGGATWRPARPTG